MDLSSKIILISGPTASGKSNFAIELAKKVKGEIINADSMQVYKELKILTARPNPKDYQKIKHHLYGFLNVTKKFSTGQWLKLSQKKIEEIRKRKKIPIYSIGDPGELTYEYTKIGDKTDDIKKSDLHEFHLLTAESTFLVRTFFFLFFGFSIPLESFVEFEPYIIGATVLLIMYGVRYFYLALVLNDEESKPLLYFSPRGLITILLFLSISDYDIQKSNIVDEKVLLVIIIASMLIMIQGSIKRTKKEDEESNEPQQSLSEIVDSQIDKK